MRRFVQSISLLALHSSWGPQAKWFCNPVLSCHSCALSWFACPVGVFVHYAGWHIMPWIALGTVLLFGVLAGRLFCGWVCPFGFLQDMLHKIPGPKFRLPGWVSWIKYVVLALMVVAIPFMLGELTVYSFCRICPASSMQVTIPAMLSGAGFTLSAMTVVKLGILVMVLVLVIFSSRGFCVAFCPIGAMLAPMNHLAFWRVKPPAESCVSCGRCDKVCPTDAKPSQRFAENVDANRAAECVACHDCRTACKLSAAGTS